MLLRRCLYSILSIQSELHVMYILKMGSARTRQACAKIGLQFVCNFAVFFGEFYLFSNKTINANVSRNGNAIFMISATHCTRYVATIILQEQFQPLEFKLNSRCEWAKCKKQCQVQCMKCAVLTVDFDCKWRHYRTVNKHKSEVSSSFKSLFC